MFHDKKQKGLHVLNKYQKSIEYLGRAEKVIPLGSQTFSKSRTQYPLGVSPYFIERAKGCKVWDIDGNEYTDFVSSLAAVTLGYQDPDVTAAVRRQLEESGVIFSLAHPIEAEVAEIICEMVPCAEMVRFGKNGSDAAAGAVRIARAYTGRDRVAVCGYHGWQDWYIGSTVRNRGVPKATSDLTHPFLYNQPDTLVRLFEAHPGQIAAVILEPMNIVYPLPGFLAEVKEIAHKHGAILIFDETITGFRFSNGGAQEEFGVIPDLACFGKGLANGYPLSAVAGRSELMREMEQIFFSFTFGGEALSLAAAKATLTKLRNEPVTRRLAVLGDRLAAAINEILVSNHLQDVFSLSGHPSWTFLNFKDAEGFSAAAIKTLWMQEILDRGVLSFGTHNLNYAHTDVDIDFLVGVYRVVLPFIGEALKDGSLNTRLKCPPLVPLFKVR
jgi:glutamate-1-semialdehyde 2,1-aminomutase